MVNCATKIIVSSKSTHQLKCTNYNCNALRNILVQLQKKKRDESINGLTCDVTLLAQKVLY